MCIRLKQWKLTGKINYKISIQTHTHTQTNKHRLYEMVKWQRLSFDDDDDDKSKKKMLRMIQYYYDHESLFSHMLRWKKNSV